MRTHCGCPDRFSPNNVDRGRVCILCSHAYDLEAACRAKNFDITIELFDCVHSNGHSYSGYVWSSKPTVDTHTDEHGNLITSKPKNIDQKIGIAFWESYSVVATEGDSFNRFIRVKR